MNKTLYCFLSTTKSIKVLLLVMSLTTGWVFKAGAQTYSWQNVTILGGGFIPAIVYSPVSPNLVYARTDIGGFYRWSAVTGAWIPLNDAESSYNLTGGESIAPDPVDSNVVYMAAGMYLSSGNGVILRSANQGTTWTVNTIGIPMGGNQNGRGMGERLAVDPNNTQILYFGSRNNGLYKSTNAASSWAQVTGFPVLGDNGYGLSFVTFDKASGSSGTGSSTIFVGVAAATSTNSNLYVSTNAGASWNIVTGGPTGMMPSHGVMGSDGNLWLTYTNDYGPYNVRGVTLSGQIWKYNIASGVWTNVTPPTTNWGGTAGGISVDAQNPQHVVISTLDWYTPDRLLATTNGGTSWNVVAQPPVSYWSTGVSTYNVNGAQYQDANGTELVGTGATNWVQAVAINPFNSNNVMYGTGAGIWASTNAGSAAANGNGAGTTWTFQDQGLEETACLGLVPSVKGAFFSTLGDIEGTRSTSLTVAGAQIGAPYSGNTVSLDFAEKDSAIVAKVTNGTPLVAYSTDNGQTWTACTAPNGTGQDIAVSATGGTFVYAPSNAVASYTTNNGSSWTTCTGVPSGARMAADRVNPNYFYATSGGNVYTSSNGGQTFTQTASGVGNNYTSLPRPVFGVEGEFWVASGSALYKVTNHGTTITAITNVTACNAVGFGMAATGQTHPAVFIIGTVGGTYGFYRSDNNATSWNQTNDSQHQYSGADYCTGDEYKYGRMYVGTNGRGILYGDIQTATAPPATITAATTTTFCTGGSVVLNANAGTGYTYQWNSGGTAISGATAASYTATTSASYTVKVTSGGLSTTSAPTVVTVNSLPTATISNGPTVSFCAGGNVVLNANTGTGLTYQWASGGTAITGATAASYTATAAGTYTVVVKNANNCSATSTGTTVTVNALPTATISNGATASFCTGGNVVLSANTGTGLTYQWENAGTAITTATAASYTATAAGAYTVTVKNTNNCSATSIGTTVTVNTLPTATISNGATASFCAGGNVVLSANTGTGLTYQWENAGTAISGATGATYTATVASTYTVVVKNANNCSTTSTGTTVTVNTLPTATISNGATASFCASGNVVLNANTGTGLTYQWSNSGTAITGATASSYTATIAGTYTVMVKNANNCSATSAGTTVTVYTAPTITTITPTNVACNGAANGSITVNASGGTPSYSYSDNGGTSYQASNVFSGLAATSYTITVKDANGCIAASSSQSITQPTVVTASIAAFTNVSCNAEATGAITVTAAGGSGVGYTYSDNGGTSYQASNTFNGLTAATYNIEVKDGNGCTGTTTQTITQPTALTATITPATTTTFCSGDSVALNANTGTGLTYQWSNNGTAITGATVASYTATTSGNYTVIVTNSNKCSAASTGTAVNVNPLPNATITPATSTTFCSGGNVVLNANTGAGLKYQWNNGGTLISGATGASYTATTEGNFAVIVTNVNNCTTTSSPITVSIDTPPSASNAGSDQYITITVANLSANTPTIGTGAWSVISGAGLFTDSTLATSSVSGLSIGANVFQWTISNGSCPASASAVTINVQTNEGPNPLTGPTTVTSGATGVSYSVPEDTGSTYHWTVPPGAIITSYSADSSQIIVNFGTSGGTIAVTQTNLYGSATSTLLVSVGDAPKTQIITGPDSVSANQAGVTYSIPDSTGSIYHWTLPPGAIITSANTDSSSITVSFGTTGGTVTVTQTNPYGSATSMLPVSISPITGIIGKASGDSYEVHPNPFSDRTTIIIHSPNTEQITLTIINLQGITCYSTSQYFTNQEFSVGSELTTDGIYFAQLAFGDEVKVLKLIKVQ